MHKGERFNTISAVAGALAAMAGLAILVAVAARRGDPWRVVSFAVYGASLVVLYASSALYHALHGRARAVFDRLDRGAIYLLIAGTYTPFALVTLRGRTGWTLFGVIWGLAVLGVFLDAARRKHRRAVSVGVYLVMGWLCVLAIKPLLAALPTPAFLWLLAGGLFYTIGVLFYALGERIRHFHGVWHLFAMAGSASHYVAVLRYLA